MMDISWSSMFGAAIIFVTVRFGIPFLLVVYRFLIAARDMKDIQRFRRSSEDWAVITGGTDGIGKCYAQELAKLGFNICIISRSSEKLDRVSNELKELNDAIQTKAIQADFTKTDIYSTLHEEFKRMKIAVLINNVGMTQPYPCKLSELPVDDTFYTGFAHCNMTSAIMTTRCAVSDGGMLSRNHGLIVNISSASGIFPLPLAAMYSSTKAFLYFLSCGLTAELRHTNIKVHTVLPFYVLTKFIGEFRPPKIFAPSPESYVRSALRMVEVENRTHGTLSHAIQGLIMTQPPEWIRKRGALYLNSLRANIVRGNLKVNT